ncbi:MAG: hypothetical protein V6Z89_09045 [Desulfobacter sp.]
MSEKKALEWQGRCGAQKSDQVSRLHRQGCITETWKLECQGKKRIRDLMAIRPGLPNCEWAGR